jgi:hypothetical protein
MRFKSRWGALSLGADQVHGKFWTTVAVALSVRSTPVSGGRRASQRGLAKLRPHRVPSLASIVAMQATQKGRARAKCPTSPRNDQSSSHGQGRAMQSAGPSCGLISVAYRQGRPLALAFGVLRRPPGWANAHIVVPAFARTGQKVLAALRGHDIVLSMGSCAWFGGFRGSGRDSECSHAVSLPPNAQVHPPFKSADWPLNHR